MASYSIQKRDKADGRSKYRCLFRVKKKGNISYTEQRTFTKKLTADTWGE